MYIHIYLGVYTQDVTLPLVFSECIGAFKSKVLTEFMQWKSPECAAQCKLDLLEILEDISPLIREELGLKNKGWRQMQRNLKRNKIPSTFLSTVVGPTQL